MLTESYSEYVGLTAEAVAAIERLRVSPEESRSNIIVRSLAMFMAPSVSKGTTGGNESYDLGQGVRIKIGEPLFLFLSKQAKVRRKWDARGEFRPDGFYLDGRKFVWSGRSVIDAAMKTVQSRIHHRNSKGEVISLSAWRQWNVLRQDRFIPLVEMKDKILAHRRSSHSIFTPEDLGL